MTILDIINSIRLDLATVYGERIPQATAENIQAVGNTLVGQHADVPYFNAFFKNLINRIGKTIVEKMDALNDIFAPLGRNIRLDLGDTIQKIFIDIPKAHAYDGTATTSMLAQERGVIHVEYTRIDRKIFYKRTLTVEEIREAFVSVKALDDLVRAIIDSMLVAYSVDMYYITLETIKRHCSYVHAKVVENSANKFYELKLPKEVCYYDATAGKLVWGNTGAKDFLKGLRVATASLKFPHKLGYDSMAYDETYGEEVGDEVDSSSNPLAINAVRTPIENQVLALEVSTLAEVDVDALAVLFNLDKAQIRTKTIELEDGSLGKGLKVSKASNHNAIYNPSDATESKQRYFMGFVCDKNSVEKIVSLEDSDSFKNPESKAVNYWYHSWGATAISKFKDFMPIVCEVVTPVEGD